MAAFLVLVVLVGFIPDSMEKIAAVERGERSGTVWHYRGDIASWQVADPLAGRLRRVLGTTAGAAAG